MKEIAKLAYLHESHVRDCVLCGANADRIEELETRIEALVTTWHAVAEERNTAEARIATLEEALVDMMNEHTPLGQHENGEIEYCSHSACRKAYDTLHPSETSNTAFRGKDGEGGAE